MLHITALAWKSARALGEPANLNICLLTCGNLPWKFFVLLLQLSPKYLTDQMRNKNLFTQSLLTNNAKKTEQKKSVIHFSSMRFVSK